MGDVWVCIHEAKPVAPGQSLRCMNWDIHSKHAKRLRGNNKHLEKLLRKRGATDIQFGTNNNTAVVVYAGKDDMEKMEIWERVKK